MTTSAATDRHHIDFARRVYMLLGAATAIVGVLLAMTGPARAATPAHTDVMFLFDTSGSMSSELGEAKEEMLKVMNHVNTTLPDVHYGVAEVRDYPSGELNEAELEASVEKPWKLDQPLTSDLSAVQKAIEPLSAFGGGDLPESYGRALLETDTNPNVGWREGAQHVIILVADNVPHDHNLDEGVPSSAWVVPQPWDTGEELPGKWGIPGTTWTPATNLHFQSIMSQLALDGKPLEDIDFSGPSAYLPYWEYWASLSGGHALGAGTAELASKITTLIETGATTPLPPCPTGQVRNGAGICIVPPKPASHATVTQVICNLVIATASDTCTATVADAAPSGSTNPSGTVTFVSTSGGVFSAGNACSLVSTPLSGNLSSCSVQFLPPTTPTSPPAITATYSGDGTHNSSSGQTHYGPLGELATHVELSELGNVTPGGTVEVPVTCGFPCSLSGEIPGSSGGTASVSSLSLGAGPGALAAAHSKKKRKKKHKAAPLGKGSLKLSNAGKGILIIKLSSKAKHTLSRLKAKGVRVTLQLTVSTADGRLVAIEKKHLRLVPRKKKGHAKHR